MFIALNTIIHNQIFLATISSWLTAQILKTLIAAKKTKRIDFKLLLGYGGMPSSHSSTVMTLCTAVGRTIGWDKPLFIVTLIFAFVVMGDAVGVRRSVGQQARVLNIMVDELYEKGTISENRVKELLGHTPIEVIAGAILGIIIAIFFT